MRGEVMCSESGVPLVLEWDGSPSLRSDDDHGGEGGEDMDLGQDGVPLPVYGFQ